MPRPRVGPEDRRTRGASLRNRNACPHVTRNIRRATLYGNLRKNAAAQIGPRMQRTLCASLCSRNACPHVTRDTFYGNLQIIEGSLEVKLPTIWTDEKQSRAEAERRERLEERRVEEKESEERRC